MAAIAGELRPNSASAASRAAAGQPSLSSLHDQAFLLGPGLIPAVNALCLAPVLLAERALPRVIPVTGLVGAPLLLGSALVTMFGGFGQVSTAARLLALPIAVWEFGLACWLAVRGGDQLPDEVLRPWTLRCMPKTRPVNAEGPGSREPGPSCRICGIGCGGRI